MKQNVVDEEIALRVSTVCFLVGMLLGYILGKLTA